MEQKSMRHGATTIIRGCTEIALAAGQHVNNFVMTKPWIAMFIVALASLTISISYGMECRAERNTSEAQLYDIQKKYDSLKICIGDNH